MGVKSVEPQWKFATQTALCFASSFRTGRTGDTRAAANAPATCSACIAAVVLPRAATCTLQPHESAKMGSVICLSLISAELQRDLRHNCARPRDTPWRAVPGAGQLKREYVALLSVVTARQGKGCAMRAHSMQARELLLQAASHAPPCFPDAGRAGGTRAGGGGATRLQGQTHLPAASAPGCHDCWRPL